MLNFGNAFDAHCAVAKLFAFADNIHKPFGIRLDVSSVPPYQIQKSIVSIGIG